MAESPENPDPVGSLALLSSESCAVIRRDGPNPEESYADATNELRIRDDGIDAL